MAGYNRFTYGVEFNRLAIPGGVDSIASSAFVSDAQVTKHLTEVFAELQTDFGYKIEVSRVDLTGDEPLYPIPRNRIGRNIKQINVLLPNGRIGPAVTQVTEQQFLNWGWDIDEANNAGAGSRNFAPYLWAFSDDDPTKFWLRPTPRYTAPDGVVISWNPQLPPLHRVYNQTVVTAAVVNGSVSVTLSAVVGSTLIQVGDEFGVKTGTNFDGSTSLNQEPVIWYIVSSVAVVGMATVLTLETAYGEASNATVGFITAQVSPIESDVAPQSLRYAPVDGALAREFIRSRPMFAAQRLMAFEAAKRNFILAEEGESGVQFGVAPEVLTFGGISRW